MKEQFKAIEVITKGLEGLSRDDKHRVLNFVQSGVYDERPQPTSTDASQAEVVEEEAEVEAEAPAKKAPRKRAPAKPKAPAVTKTEVLESLRAYAEKHDSKDMAMQVLHDVSGVKKLGEVDVKFYAKLVKALAV